VTKRENRKKEEKQKRKGEFYSSGIGLSEETTESALNTGTRGNARKKIRTAAIDGKVKRSSCKRCGRIDHVNSCKKCPYHKEYVIQPGADSDIVAEMKKIYPGGMHLKRVVEVEEVTFVDTTVVDERELNTGKWQ
jgi:hypothetical protein